MKLATGPLGKLFPFLLWWPLVTRGALRADLLAGLTGALIVLPQGVAFATIAGHRRHAAAAELPAHHPMAARRLAPQHPRRPSRRPGRGR